MFKLYQRIEFHINILLFNLAQCLLDEYASKMNRKKNELRKAEDIVTLSTAKPKLKKCNMVVFVRTSPHNVKIECGSHEVGCHTTFTAGNTVYENAAQCAETSQFSNCVWWPHDCNFQQRLNDSNQI